MSRIGKKPVAIPQGVKIEQNGLNIKASGPAGSMLMTCHPKIKVRIADGNIIVENENQQDREARQVYGTMRALINNMVTGVSKGFQRKMEIYGTGYNVKEQGGKLVLQVGNCSPAELPIPKAVKVQIEVPATKGNEVPAKFTLLSSDKCILGQFASMIRKVKPPEPYKGKGVRYADEQIKHKVGKAFTSGTA